MLLVGSTLAIVATSGWNILKEIGVQVPVDIGEGAVANSHSRLVSGIIFADRRIMSTSTGSGHCRPESNLAPGPTQSTARILMNLSPGPFPYEALNSISTSVAGEVNTWESPLEDHQRAQCSCAPFLGSIVKQLRGGRNRSTKISGLRGVIPETPAASFLFRLMASYGRLRESIKETNLNVYDLFVGTQMLCLLTATPIFPRMKTLELPGSGRRFPMTASSTVSGSAPDQKMNDARVQSLKSVPSSRGCVSNADRRLISFRR